MNPTNSPILEVRKLTCRGVGPFTLKLDAGECVALSGSSGVGKSLLLRAISDLEPHGGEVVWSGINSTSVSGPAWRKRVGYLAAESEWWSVRVEDHFFSAEARERLPELGFDPAVWSASVAELSTGERQRLALLRLLANHPQVLLLDEPTASLDPDNTARVEQLVAGFRQQHHTPILWVSHDQKQIERIADRRLILDETGLQPHKVAA